MNEALVDEALADAAQELEFYLPKRERLRILTQALDWIMAQTSLFPDAVPTLEYLRQHGLKLAVVSNVIFPGALFERAFKSFGIKQHFDAFVWSSEIGKRKPHPAMFTHALNILKVERREAIHVGDMLNQDVFGAHQAGLRVVWVDRGDTANLETKPDWTIQNLQELIPIIEGMQRIT